MIQEAEGGDAVVEGFGRAKADEGGRMQGTAYARVAGEGRTDEGIVIVS